MSDATVSELWTYPIKSCQGVPVASVELTDLGVTGDRRFAIWADGKLVEQKLTPRVAAIGAGLDDEIGLLTLTHPTGGVYGHEVRSDGPLRETSWLYERFQTIDQGDAVAAWLSEALELSVRLVAPSDPWRINFPIPQMAALHDRQKHSFTAASPVGLANQSSLDDLNTKLDIPVPMDRFRMNVIVDGLEPYAEETVVSLANDEVEIRQVTVAERCVIVTTDQQTGERPENNLMQALATHRKKSKEERFGSGLKFGNYMMVGRPGTLRVGDRLTVT